MIRSARREITRREIARHLATRTSKPVGNKPLRSLGCLPGIEERHRRGAAEQLLGATRSV
jgi:hypothetical protein